MAGKKQCFTRLETFDIHPFSAPPKSQSGRNTTTHCRHLAMYRLKRYTRQITGVKKLQLFLCKS